MLIYQSLWIASKNDMKCPWKIQKQFHWNGFFCCFDQLFADASPFYGAINDPTKRLSAAEAEFPRRGHQPLYLGQKAIIWQDFCRKLHENASLDTRLPCIRQWLCPQILKKKHLTPYLSCPEVEYSSMISFQRATMSCISGRSRVFSCR